MKCCCFESTSTDNETDPVSAKKKLNK
ncbi:unnamed protein product, partial [Cuscuta europaea]